MTNTEAVISLSGYLTNNMEMSKGNAISMADTEIIFEELFKSQYKRLHAYAYTLLKDEDEAEETVQNVFVRLWEKKDKISTLQSINAYLYRSVYNECINQLKHKKVKDSYRTYAIHTHNETELSQTENKVQQLEERLRLALASLPEQCRTIFQMSRFEELKYREIAERLDLSIKTVENQMGKALKLMRIKMADLLPILWILLENM